MPDSAETRRYPWFVAPAAVLVRLLLGIVLGTCRVVEISGEEHLKSLEVSGRAAVFTFWHNRSNFCGHFLRKRWLGAGRPLGIITSRSQDGEIAARTARMSGLRVARGSVGGGGLSGLKALHRMVRKENVSVLSVADGSRGPVYQAQAGVIVLAQTAKAPLVPISYVASSCWRLNSWDRMIVPKPFARIAVAIGKPIEYPQPMDKETQKRARLVLKETLDALTTHAQAGLGS
jgi:lysophospholipid acyltransferase (LPLAT)-like uncharacterized protein